MTERDDLLSELADKLAFQQKWRRVMSISYFTATAVALACSAAAAIVAALGYAFWASVLAGGATALFGIEKTLLLREKWSHHLGTAAQLEALEVEFRYGGLGQEEAAKRLAKLLVEYAGRLPTAPLDTNK
jgi:membrane protein YdbS with pleckstrin-like domain